MLFSGGKLEKRPGIVCKFIELIYYVLVIIRMGRAGYLWNTLTPVVYSAKPCTALLILRQPISLSDCCIRLLLPLPLLTLFQCQYPFQILHLKIHVK